MKKILFYYYLFSVFLGTSIYFAAFFEIQLPGFIRFYVNDFLIIPIVLTTCLYLIRYLKNNSKFRLSFAQVMYIAAFYAVIFEYWLPKFHPRYTVDFIDVILYFLSAVLFYFMQKNTSI
jgi:hypothetical protein